MDENEKREKLLLDILSLINSSFKNSAILKGGLVLRLLNSPRYTQDIDYIFTTKQSRKSILPIIEKALAKENIKITRSLINSRGLFINVEDETKTLAQIEISIDHQHHPKTEVISTASLSIKNGRTPELITILARDVGFSHKIAATLERDALRDFYDLSLYEPLTNIDSDTLEKRLSALEINRKKMPPYSFEEAANLLEKKINSTKDQDLEQGLKQLLPESYRFGIAPTIKASVLRVCEKIRHLRACPHFSLSQMKEQAK